MNLLLWIEQEYKNPRTNLINADGPALQIQLKTIRWKLSGINLIPFVLIKVHSELHKSMASVQEAYEMG